MVYTVSSERKLDKIVSVCIRQEDYDKLAIIAKRNGVRVSVYIRSIIVDAVADEEDGK